MMSTLPMEVAHEGHVDHVRRLVQQTALRLGADVSRAREAGFVAEELANNMVRHGGGGELLLREVMEGAACALEIHALDKGSGIPGLSACLRGGAGAATGLGGVRRMAGQFQIYSRPGQGTAIWARLPLTGAGPPGFFDCGGVSVPLKGEELCGDSWDFRETASILHALVVDGLGHGPFAEAAARKAVSVFRQQEDVSPSESLLLMHQALFQTRGAAASAVRIDTLNRTVTTAGVGNVMMRVHGDSGSKILVGDNGTLGSSVRKMRNLHYPWESGSLLILHSDGISSRWDLEKYPGLARQHPGLIAGVLYRDFRHRHDDATVLVIRQSALRGDH